MGDLPYHTLVDWIYQILIRFRI